MPERIGLQALFEDKDFRRGIANYTKKVQEAERTTDAAAGKITKDTKQIGKSWQDSAQQVGMATTIMAAALTAILVKVTLTAARSEELGIVLNRVGQNIGQTAGQMAEYEDGVKSMGITTQAARQALIQMVQAQIDLGHSTDLARLAQDAAVIANINSSEAFERLVTVIQRGSPLMARTLGIIVDFDGAYNRWAEANDRTAASLTTAEKVHIRTLNVLENSAQIAGTYEAAMDTAGKQLRSMTRYTEELANELGESLLPVMGGAVKTGTDLLKWALDMDPVLRSTIVQTLAFSTAILAVGKAATTTIPKLIAMALAMGPLGIAGALIAGAAAFIIYQSNMEEAYRAEAATIAETATSYDNYILQLRAAALEGHIFSQELWEIIKAKKAVDEEFDTKAFVDAREEIERLTDSTQLFTEAGDFTSSTLDTMVQKIAENISALSDEAIVILSVKEEMEDLAASYGAGEEAQEEFANDVYELVEAERILRYVIDAATVSIGNHEDRMLGIADAFAISTSAARAWARALERTVKTPFVPVKGTAKSFMGLNAEEIKELEKARAAAAKGHEKVLNEMQSNEESYANALGQLYDQIVSTAEQAEQARLNANENYTRDAIRLEENLARDRGRILQDLAQDLSDMERDQAQDRIRILQDIAQDLSDMERDLQQDRADAVRELNRDLEDLDAKLVAKNEKTWVSYYATLESLAIQHGERVKAIEERYAKARQDILEKYRTEPTRQEEIDTLRDDLQRQLEALGRPRGYTERQQQAEILAALEALKDEELAILLAAQDEEMAAEEAAYQEEQTLAATRREEQLTANQEWLDAEEEQRQLAYDRKLEDLRISAEQEREERNLAAERQLEDLRVRGEQEREERHLAARRQLEDLRVRGDVQRAELARQHQEQLNEITRGLNAETEGFRMAYGTQLSDLQTYLNQRTQQWRDHQRAIENLLEMGSPSRWMERIGKGMRAGLDVGFSGPSIATDLQNAVASFGKAANNLSVPGALGGGGNSSTSNVTNHNLDFKASFTKPETERSVRDMLRLTQNMLRMRTME